MSVELALTPDGRWDTDLLGLVQATADAGFHALGVSAGAVDDATAGLLSSAGLRCHELLALMVSDDEDATVSTAEGLATAATRVDAQWVLTVFRSALTDETAAIIARCAAVFADAGSAMAVEFSPIGPISDIRAGLDVVEAAGSGAGLMIDTWHFSHGTSTFEDLAAVPLERIAYVQFTDALAPVSESLGRETMNRRALPGAGVLDLDRFASTLLERGYDGLVSVEVLSEELRALPIDEIARRAHDTTARYWS